MRLVPASLQPYVSKAIKFFQIHEEYAALHTFLLYLDTLRTNRVYQNSTFVLKTGTNLFETKKFVMMQKICFYNSNV